VEISKLGIKLVELDFRCKLRPLGLRVSTKMPAEVLELIGLYPQPVRAQPTVESFFALSDGMTERPSPVGFVVSPLSR
jgi:hypothetical protein